MLVAVCGRVRKIAYRHYCIALSGRLPKEASGVSLGNFAIISADCAGDERSPRHGRQVRKNTAGDAAEGRMERICPFYPLTFLL